jgi:hypothetical protein
VETILSRDTLISWDGCPASPNHHNDAVRKYERQQNNPDNGTQQLGDVVENRKVPGDEESSHDGERPCQYRASLMLYFLMYPCLIWAACGRFVVLFHVSFVLIGQRVAYLLYFFMYPCPDWAACDSCTFSCILCPNWAASGSFVVLFRVAG